MPETMIPHHLDLPWRVEVEDGWACVVTDVPRTGPFYYVCRVYECLPGDQSGVKAAQHIVNLHNDEIRRKRATIAISQ